MDTNIIRNRKYLKDELRDYFYYCCRNTDPISNKLIASALGEPDYTIYSIGEFGDPLCKSREYRVLSWVLMDWPYFRNIIQFGGVGVQTKQLKSSGSIDDTFH